MKKLLASTAAALALGAVAVTGVPGTPVNPEGAEAAGCSTWQSKVEEKSGAYQLDPLDGNFTKEGYAYTGYYVNTVYAPAQNVTIRQADGSLTTAKLMTGTLYNHKKEQVMINLGIRKANLDYVNCW